jgi:hypothetical protein
MTKTIKISTKLLLLFSLIYLIGCSKDDDISPEEEPVTEEVRIGFELVNIISPDSILVWTNEDILTQEQFDSIQLPSSWTKNEPREGMPNFARFLRSPDASQDGDFTTAEHFGYNWLFNAIVIENNVPLPSNDQGLLTGRYIGKYHEVTFNAGRTISVLISPNGEEYILISRDANRTTDIPLIPPTWQIEERVISEELTLELPNPTLNIRAENNQDSWQGPVDL